MPTLLTHTKGLLPFAVLSQSENRENILRQISQQIDEIPDRREKSNVAALDFQTEEDLTQWFSNL